MFSADSILAIVKAEGISFFTGVPDSLLKHFCACLTDQAQEKDHVIAANEGNAIALATGFYLGTGSPALVYMQNSGLGNAVNPLMSLADPEVYGIPMMLMIGWRGEPGTKDEPQHIKQGRVMTGVLDALQIPWYVLGPDTNDAGTVIKQAAARMREIMGPVALVVRNNSFTPYGSPTEPPASLPLSREHAIGCIVDQLSTDDVVVSTTGMTSRELYEYRVARGDGHGGDFLTVGAMGHTASIAMGLALSRPERRVICLDGDGSVIMHMGSLAVIGQSGLANLVHIVINNGAHDSVGGQATVGLKIDLVSIAKAAGYRKAALVCTELEVERAFVDLVSEPGPALLEIRVRKGARPDLGRPKYSPTENRRALMKRLSS